MLMTSLLGKKRVILQQREQKVLLRLQEHGTLQKQKLN